MSFSQFVKKWFFDIDRYTLFFAIGLIILGIFMSFSVGPVVAKRIHLSSYYFTTRHLLFSFVGIVIMIFLSMLTKKNIINLCFVGLLVCLFMLFLCHFTGANIKGARRWINIGFFALQPSEIMKPFFVVANAYLLSARNRNKFISSFSFYLIAVILTLLVIQPDFGMTITYLSVWFVQIFLGSVNIFVLFGFAIIGVIAITILGMFFFQHFYNRIFNFIHMRGGHEQYQTKKAIESIYNGNFFGTGLCEGDVKYQLPDAHTDYIFSSICEEFGLIFACLMICCYMCFAYRHLASNYRNTKFNIRVIYGLVLIFLIQTCFHIGININFFPSKGMTLPLVSYGGSSMLSSCIIFGFLLAFTRKTYLFKSPYKEFKYDSIT